MSNEKSQALDVKRMELADTSQYLSFEMAEEEYAIQILSIQEIKSWDQETPMPNTPNFINGVVNLRGELVPIIDLRTMFNMDKIEYGESTVVIVMRVKLDGGTRKVGIVVDAISDVHHIDDQNLQAPSEFGSSSHVDYIKGLVTVDEKMIILLHANKIIEEGILKSLAHSE